MKVESFMNYPIKFRSAILEENNKPLVINYVTFEGPLKPGHVLVRVHYSGICGKQVEEIQGTAGDDPFLPHMLGHEGSGVIVDTGPGVTKVNPDDHVVLHWLKGSGIDAETPLYSRSGERVNAGWVTTFNEYAVVSENRLTKISKDSDMIIASLLGCAVITGVGTILNDAHVKPGDSIAVFGCGGVGLSAILGAVLTKSHPIIGVDKNKESLDLARICGADGTINSVNSDVLAEIHKMTKGKGADHIIIAVGDQGMMEMAVRSGAVPGNVYFVAVPPQDMKISINPLDIHRQKHLFGSCGGGCFPDRDIPKYLGLYERGELKLDNLLTHTVSLDQINYGISSMLTGKPGRCVVKMV